MRVLFQAWFFCGTVQHRDEEWIVDSGATDHMTGSLSVLSNVHTAPSHYTIKLPTGDVAEIAHVGDIILKNGLKLLGVLHVPSFQHNLLSIHKLAHDNKCQVMFHPEKCLIIQNQTNEVQGIGYLRFGLYYISEHTGKAAKECYNSVSSSKLLDYGIWHNRLGHAPSAKIMLIDHVKNQIKTVPSHVCVTCPLTKFTKLPFSLSDSHAEAVFDMVHMDIWGPYKVSTRGKYMYFLTIVDDHTIMVWVYLLQYKSEFCKIIVMNFMLLKE